MTFCSILNTFVYYAVWLIEPPTELPAPEDVRITRSDTTNIEISWRKFTLVELKALANYTITYIAATPSSKRQTADTISVPWTENRTTITNLNPGESYDITVSTTAASRISGIILACFEPLL